MSSKKIKFSEPKVDGSAIVPYHAIQYTNIILNGPIDTVLVLRSTFFCRKPYGNVVREESYQGFTPNKQRPSIFIISSSIPCSLKLL